MWSYVKIPLIPGENSIGVVCLERYYVSEGDLIESGSAIAVMHSDHATCEVVSNYRGRILKIILSENTLVGFRDPIATMELLQDPMDGVLIEHCKVLRRSSG